MTTEQLKELSEALSILSTTSSVRKERAELRALMEENLQAEEVGYFFFVETDAGLTKLTGPKITIWCFDETDPFDAYEDRRSAAGIRLASW